MTSSTWSFESAGRLLACGADCETIERFEGLLEAEEHPMPLVFTRAEVEHARRLADPARGLCLAFCVKEALRKALTVPYELTECEAFGGDTGERAEVRLSPGLAAAHGIGGLAAVARDDVPGRGEVLIVLYLFAN